METRRSFLVRVGAVAALLSANGCIRRGTVRANPSPRPVMDVATFHNTRRTVSLLSGRISFLDVGPRRAPATLFIHGYPLNGFQWRGVIALVGEHRRCLAPDMMGLGYSEVPSGQTVRLSAQMQMLVAFLDALRVAQVDIIANDSGGATAQLLAAHHPGRVRSLLLTNCDTIDDSPPPSFVPIIAAAKAGTLAASIARQLQRPALARSPAGMGGQAFSDPSHLTDDILGCYFTPLVSSPLRRQQVEAFAIALEQNPLLGIESTLRTLRAPVRVVWGMADTVFSPAGADWLDHNLPGSRGVRRVPGAKLFFPEEMPEIVAEEALRLWAT